MGEKMTFPNSWKEYEELYGFTDSEQIYTNGARLIPSFRVEQWLDNEKELREQKTGKWIHEDDGSASYRCSECGKHQYGNYSEIFMGVFHFCPNCGASRSEGEENEKA